MALHTKLVIHHKNAYFQGVGFIYDKKIKGDPVFTPQFTPYARYARIRWRGP